MEKNQQNNSASPSTQQGSHEFTNGQPGQQLPANTERTNEGAGENEEQHSESSFPQNDNETLGTP